MRCLFCNKKLSLLKLAKGDSFCSPDHFDKYQLQQSKNAFERLMNQPEVDTPKAPLTVKPVEQAEETAPSPKVKKTPAQIPAAEPAQLVPEQSSAQPKTDAPHVPPYAPFATQEQPFCPSVALSQIADEPVGKQPIDSPQALAWPTHDVHATVAILNLHLELSGANLTPSPWTSTREFAVVAEPFAPAVIRPVLAMKPDSPEIPHLKEIEATAAEHTTEHEVPVSVEAQETKKPAVTIQPGTPAGVRVAYLTAKSFGIRRGAATFLDRDATSRPSALKLAPVLGDGIGSLPQRNPIPSRTNPVQAIFVHAQDFAAAFAEGLPQLPIVPDRILPAAKNTTRGDAWIPSASLIAIARGALETELPETRSADFDLPRPASFLVRPDPGSLRCCNPKRLGGDDLDTNSPMAGALRMAPISPGSAAYVRPAGPMASDLGPAFAPLDPQGPFAPVLWPPNTNHRRLNCSMAAAAPAPFSAQGPLAYSAAVIQPSPYWVVSPARSPWRGVAETRPLPCRKFDWVADTGFTPGLWPVFSASPNLPETARISSGAFSRGTGPSVKWEPRPPGPLDARAAKFLPVRETASLPAARPWQKLGSLPR